MSKNLSRVFEGKNYAGKVEKESRHFVCMCCRRKAGTVSICTCVVNGRKQARK